MSLAYDTSKAAANHLTTISGQKHVEDVRREILRFIGEIDSKIDTAR